MTHMEQLDEMGIRDVFIEAFNKYSSVRESGLQDFLDDLECKSLSTVISSFAVWDDTDEGYAFWSAHAERASTHRNTNINIEKIIKEM